MSKARMPETTVVTTPHPFARLQNPSRWEIIRMILALLTGFAVLRFLLIVSSLIVLGFLTVALHHLKLKSMCAYTLRFLCRWLLFVAGHFWIPIKGNTEIFSRGKCPKIIVSNHISNMEILHLLSLPFQDESGNPVLPVFITKQTIFDVPVVGVIARDVLGSIGVARKASNPKQQPKSCTEQILERIQSKSNSHGPIAIFPEGTTTNGTCLLKFRTGAFVPMVPVVPAVYKFGTRASDPSTSDFLPTYESIWGPAYLWRLLSQIYHPFECRFLNTLDPQRDAVEFAQHAQQIMALESGLPMLSEDYNYAHKLKYHGGLRKAFLEHPKGPKYAMCFAPMQGYQLVKGMTFVETNKKVN